MNKILIVVISLILSSCTTAINLQKYNNQQNTFETSKLIEPPYEINGRWFFPYDYKELIEIGTASRIQMIQSGDKTKNGEVFHHDVATGAHRTLGLASNVRVTNLDNGYSMIVRINHRGSYSNINIIELSDHVFSKLQINDNENLVKIELLNDNETFILNEAKTYTEEKKIASNAPVDGVAVLSIDNNNLDSIDVSVSNNEINLNDFRIIDSYRMKDIYLHIATLSFKKNAKSLKSKLNSIENTNIINSMINGKNSYKVVIGPFKNLSELTKVLNNDTIQKYEDLSIYMQ